MLRRASLLSVVLPCVLLASAPRARADGPTPRLIELDYVPTARAQVAVWLERSDGTFVRTLRLTEAVALRGIGNRPGASQMNSGFRWPYGRREGVLPVWAHRRVASGAAPFRRVIFQDRESEGFASRTSNDSTPDSYFCLSFNDATTRRDALDAVACASVFNSDKGRYVTETDVTAGYAEPQADPEARMAPLSLDSVYPPRRDVAPCASAGCADHADLARFDADARAAMPEIDAVSMATAAGGETQTYVYTVPPELPDGDYVVYVEVNVEGDYNATFDDTTYPTPTTPAAMWDYWAMAFGYAYRGQPSVVYAVPVRVGWVGERAVSAAYGYGSVSGQGEHGGDLTPFGPEITDDPIGAPGSGADRLMLGARSHRLRVTYVGPRGADPGGPLPCIEGDTRPECAPPPAPCTEGDPRPECATPCTPGDSRPECASPCVAGDPRPECATPCTPGDSRPECAPAPCTPGDPRPECAPPPAPCTSGVICQCAAGNTPPDALREFVVTTHPDDRESHRFALAHFVAPADDVGVTQYEVRVGTQPITDLASFLRALPAKAPELDSVALRVPTTAAPGEVVEFELGGLDPQTRYYVGVRALDACGEASPIAVSEVTTTPIVFTVVSPCFVATAAHGTPFAAEIGVLRRFRDRHLLTNAPGRAFVRAYYAIGPTLAAYVREDDTLRAAVRAVLTPVVALAEALDGSSTTAR
jgi:hypothetical protein